MDRVIGVAVFFCNWELAHGSVFLRPKSGLGPRLRVWVLLAPPFWICEMDFLFIG